MCLRGPLLAAKNGLGEPLLAAKIGLGGPLLAAKIGLGWDHFWQGGTTFGNQKWSGGTSFGRDHFWHDRIQGCGFSETMKLTVLSAGNSNIDGSNGTTENQQANSTKHNCIPWTRR